eukprot:TRINITY_DN3675_c0_g1_i3.p1 TRINITY_DN3675_c0_g1~~TRINITY_DN3675_c0_g1_i3.p1  ORF type:complete len:469 (-),score=64.41 TRINITY_DN3675_c0_g1_i3:1124-2530(-)
MSSLPRDKEGKRRAPPVPSAKLKRSGIKRKTSTAMERKNKLLTYQKISSNRDILVKLAELRTRDFVMAGVNDNSETPSWFQLLEKEVESSDPAHGLKISCLNDENALNKIKIDLIKRRSTRRQKLGNSPLTTRSPNQNSASIIVTSGTIGTEYVVDFVWDWEQHQDESADPMDEFDLHLIGKGNFGKVYRALHKKTGFVLCVKVQAIKGDGDTTVNDKEVKILRKLRHPNIVSFYGCCRVATSNWIMMEFCAGGSLHQLANWLLKTERFLSMIELRFITKSILDGLVLMHEEGVIHRDLKPANIILTGTGIVKIADFGASGLFEDKVDAGDPADDTKQFSTLTGTIKYMAPEVIDHQDGETYGSRVDVWSLGMTMLHVADGKYLFEGRGVMKILQSLLDPSLPLEPKRKDCHEEFKSFLAKCFERNYNDRPNSKELLPDAWVASPLAGSDGKITFQETLKLFRSENVN